MTTDIISLDNLDRIMRELQETNPQLAEEIIADAQKMAKLIGQNNDEMMKLVNESRAELSSYLDEQAIENAKEIINRSE